METRTTLSLKELKVIDAALQEGLAYQEEVQVLREVVQDLTDALKAVWQGNSDGINESDRCENYGGCPAFNDSENWRKARYLCKKHGVPGPYSYEPGDYKGDLEYQGTVLTPPGDE